MNISVNTITSNFENGVSKLNKISIEFSNGEWPNQLNGNVELSSDDNLTLESSEEEIMNVAKQKIKTLLSVDF